MAEEVEAAVRITLKDVWTAQQETNKQVARLVDQLPDHVKQTEDDLKEVRQAHADHESRLRKLEARMWMLFGGLALLSALSTIITNYLQK